MANNQITTGVLSGLAGLGAGTVLGAALQGGGFFESQAPSGIVTPGGALNANAQAALTSGQPSGTPAATGFPAPASTQDAVGWLKSNPLIALGIAGLVVFLIVRAR